MIQFGVYIAEYRVGMSNEEKINCQSSSTFEFQ